MRDRSTRGGWKCTFAGTAGGTVKVIAAFQFDQNGGTTLVVTAYQVDTH